MDTLSVKLLSLALPRNLDWLQQATSKGASPNDNVIQLSIRFGYHATKSTFQTVPIQQGNSASPLITLSWNESLLLFIKRPSTVSEHKIVIELTTKAMVFATYALNFNEFSSKYINTLNDHPVTISLQDVHNHDNDILLTFQANLKPSPLKIPLSLDAALNDIQIPFDEGGDQLDDDDDVDLSQQVRLRLCVLARRHSPVCLLVELVGSVQPVLPAISGLARGNRWSDCAV